MRLSLFVLLAATSAAAAPAVTADDVLSIEALRATPHPEQDQVLVALIQSTPDTDANEKSDYYFRLATNYVAEARDAKTEQRAKDARLKAVKTFKALVDNDAFRNYPRLDMVLFLYGYTLQQGGDLPAARVAYDRILKDFPTSKYVPEVHLAVAESAQPSDAKARYAQVLKYPHARGYWYAMYKLSAIAATEQHVPEAIEGFRKVVEGTRNDPKQAAVTAAAVAALATLAP